MLHFYSRPCGRGDRYANLEKRDREKFLLTPLREGRLCPCSVVFAVCSNFYSRPCGRGDGRRRRRWTRTHHFYSRPCGRGDSSGARLASASVNFYSRPCGRGDLRAGPDLRGSGIDFYSRPCGRGDRSSANTSACRSNFYSRPCGRGDSTGFVILLTSHPFLLTPLREGRQARQAGALCGADFYSRPCGRGDKHIRLIRPHPVISTHAPAGGATPAMMHSAKPTPISTHAPAGGATDALREKKRWISVFLLTPLREGRRISTSGRQPLTSYFYSRPCGRGDLDLLAVFQIRHNFYSRPCGRGDLV